MWELKGFCFCICTACLLDVCYAVIAYEGENFVYHVKYLPGYEKNSKYFGRSDGFFFEKLVQTNESNRWAKQGRYALFDNTSACIFTAAILGLTTEDSGMYTFGVDVKMLPDPDTEIQLTVKKAEPPRPTTTPPTVVVHSTNSPTKTTAMIRTKTRDQESSLSAVNVLGLVCVCTLLVACPCGLYKVLKWASTCKLSVSVSYHTKKPSARAIEEYVKMSPIVRPDSLMAKGSEDFCSCVNTEPFPDTDASYTDAASADLDHIYTEMKPRCDHTVD